LASLNTGTTIDNPDAERALPVRGADLVVFAGIFVNSRFPYGAAIYTA
jgi:hypothetical protein